MSASRGYVAGEGIRIGMQPTVKIGLKEFEKPFMDFFIAIRIPIENMIRINQTLIQNFSSNLDFYFSTRL